MNSLLNRLGITITSLSGFRVHETVLSRARGRCFHVTSFEPLNGYRTAWELLIIGLRTSGVFGKREPQRVLVDEVRNWEADSIFVGSTQFQELLREIPSRQCLDRIGVTSAPCSVEVVR